MLSVAVRCFRLLIDDPRGLFNIEKVVGEKSVSVRVEAVRYGLFTGVFTGGFNLVFCYLNRRFGRNNGWNSVIAGSIAGLAVLFQPKAMQKTLALYSATRLVECLYNEYKHQGKIKPLPHGESLLFILGSAQVMYAYVMRRETLPASYFKFIQRSGPIPNDVLLAVRDNCRGRPHAQQAIFDMLAKKCTPARANQLTETMKGLGSIPPGIPCDILHPSTEGCYSNGIKVFIDSFKKLFPLYASLTFTPMIVLKFMSLITRPHKHIPKGLLSATRSSTFLATFIAVYQVVVCGFKNTLFKVDHRSIYYISGLISSLSIFIERRTRRAELALYVLPRSLDSLFLQFVDHKWLIAIPAGEVGIFCAAMGGLMYFFHDHTGTHKTMAPLIRTILTFVFNRKTITSAASSKFIQ